MITGSAMRGGVRLGSYLWVCLLYCFLSLGKNWDHVIRTFMFQSHELCTGDDNTLTLLEYTVEDRGFDCLFPCHDKLLEQFPTMLERITNGQWCPQAVICTSSLRTWTSKNSKNLSKLLSLLIISSYQQDPPWPVQYIPTLAGGMRTWRKCEGSIWTLSSHGFGYFSRAHP